MLPIFTPNYELLKFLNENMSSMRAYAWGLEYAASSVRVMWLANTYGVI